jgi:hypothetical protein
MLSYHLLKQHPRVLRAFTSLDPEEFELLLIPFAQAWEASPVKVARLCSSTHE